MQNIKETFLNLMGQQINPLNVAALSDGIYFKMAGGEKMRMFLKGGQWVNPLAQAQEGEETIYADHDKVYDYKIVNGQWQTRRKGTEGDWIDLSTNEAATNKLNTAYPDALTAIEESTNNNANDGVQQEDLNSIVDDSQGQPDGLQLNKDNLKFVSPREGNVLSPLGDTNILDLVSAVDATVKDFKDGYYDPGTKADYTKFSHTNTTDEDLYIDPEALAKGKKTGDVLKDAEQMTEIEMQKYLDERAKNNPQMYDKVKNFDADLFEKTGYVDRRRGLFNRKVNQDDLKEGDYLENKYKNASHIGFSVDEKGKYTKGFDYLTANEDGVTFNQQSFDGFQNPNSGGDDSREYERSDKHNDDYNFANDISFESYRNAGINHNMNLEDDDPFGYTKIPSAGPLAPIGIKQIPTNIPEPKLQLADPTELYLDNIENELKKSQGPLDQTNPEAVINANDQISLDEANQRYANDLNGLVPRAKPVGPRADGRGLRYGGSLPKAQNGLNEFCANAPLINSGGKVFAQCRNRDFDSKHDAEIGATMSLGKLNNDFTSSFGLSGGYTFNPSGGTGGLKTYIGGNYGLRGTEDSSVNDGLNGTNVNMNNYMKGLIAAGYTGEVGGNSYNWQTPLQYELGAYADKDLMGNDGTTFGGYGRVGPVNIKGGYNRNTGSEFSIGLGLPIRQAGGWFSDTWNSVKENASDVLDYTQTGLTAGGLTPGYGIFADAANTLISGGRAAYAGITGDDEGLKTHTENALLNATSAIPGPAGWAAGGIALANDTAKYTGAIDNQSISSNIADSFAPSEKESDGVLYGQNLGFDEETSESDEMNLTRYGAETNLQKFQFAGSPDASGYNPLTNQFTPINFNTELKINPISMNMLNNQTTPAESTPPTQNYQADMYASQQSVNRSMDSFDAFTADMNQRMQNPSLQMNQVDTNPLSTPDISLSMPESFLQTRDKMNFISAQNDGRVTSDGQVIKSAEEMKAASDATSAKLKETVDSFPEYQGTKENLRRFDRANELGFEGDLAAMDEYDQNETEEGIKRELREDKLNKDNKDANPSLGDKIWNAKNRLLDSKAGQTYGKIGAGAVRIAKPLNRLLEQKEERETLNNQMQNAYLSDNMFASRDADLSGSKGDYDVNSGIFRAEDKITTRQGKYGTEISNYLTFAKNGGSFFNDGGEAEIDINMYKELIAAGADIEII